VLSIGHRPGLEAFHTRTLHLVRTPGGAMLHHGRPDETAQAWSWPGLYPEPAARPLPGEAAAMIAS
jgi:putative ATP-binding cassette transporter